MKIQAAKTRWLRSSCALLVLSALLLTQTRLSAESPLSLADILKRSQAAINKLGYVEYTVKCTPILQIKHPRLQLTWRENGDKLSYNYIQFKDNGAENFRADYSYDGQQSFNDWYGSGIYEEKRAPRPFDHWLKNTMFITAPFNFLLQNKGVPAWTRPNIGVLQNAQTWEKMVKDSVVIGTQKYNNRDCLVVRVNNAQTGWQPELNVHYLVYFDERTAMPVAWNVYDKDDHLMEENNVAVEQNVLTDKHDAYLAPKQIRSNFYLYDDVKKINELSQTWIYDFSAVSTDESLGEGFVLDPTKATQIHDQDNKIYIHIPK